MRISIIRENGEGPFLVKVDGEQIGSASSIEDARQIRQDFLSPPQATEEVAGGLQPDQAEIDREEDAKAAREEADRLALEAAAADEALLAELEAIDQAEAAAKAKQDEPESGPQ